jgi:hypothetical protein
VIHHRKNHHVLQKENPNRRPRRCRLYRYSTPQPNPRSRKGGEIMKKGLIAGIIAVVVVVVAIIIGVNVF